MKDFYGDSTRWFVGVVVNHTPPASYEGRVKVRIRGVHSESTTNIPEADLPWAQVIIPTTEEGVSGLGSTPKLTTGATVFGFFLDGNSSQIPVVIGSFTKTEFETTKQGTERKDIETFPYVKSWEDLLIILKGMNRSITKANIHKTQSVSNKDLDASELDYIHKKVGYDNIQYHYVILRDGMLQKGASINEDTYQTGAIEVALIGGIQAPSGTLNPTQYVSEGSITRAQFNTLEKFSDAFYTAYPNLEIIGNDDVVEIESIMAGIFRKGL